MCVSDSDEPLDAADPDTSVRPDSDSGSTEPDDDAGASTEPDDDAGASTEPDDDAGSGATDIEGCSYPSSPPHCDPSSTSSDYNIDFPTHLTEEFLGCYYRSNTLEDFPAYSTPSRALCAGEDAHYFNQSYWQCNTTRHQVKITLQTQPYCTSAQFDLKIYCKSDGLASDGSISYDELSDGQQNARCAVSGSNESAQDGSITKIVTLKAGTSSTSGKLKMGVFTGDAEANPDANIQFGYTLSIEPL